MSAAVTLNRQVSLQAPSTAKNAYNEPVGDWVEVAGPWAGIEDISGREFVAAGATQNATVTKITIRYRPGVAKTMRIVCAGQAYNIEAVLGKDRRWLLLMCSEGVRDG